MKYKKSKFNLEIDQLENEKILLFNTRTTALGIMDKKTQIIYDSIEEKSDMEIETLKENQDFQPLFEYGYVIPDNMDELKLLKIHSQNDKYNKNTFTLTIAPTLDCNMACPYCFENKKSISMSKEIQLVLCDFVENHLKENRCKEFIVTWYGGEPLLEKEIIYDLSKQFISICQKYDVIYGATIITNGYLLDLESAKKLVYECRVTAAQITIDGLPEYHDKRRILKNGESSFNTIVQNIEQCKKIMHISVRVNVDHNNIKNISELTQFFIHQVKWIDNPICYLAPVEQYDDNCYFKDDKCLKNNEFYEIAKQFIQTLYDSNSTAMKKNLYPSLRSNFCGAVKLNNYVIDPEGYLYKCWNVIGNHDFSVGNIINNQIFGIEHIKWLSYEPTGKCLNCKMLPLCIGGCPYKYFSEGVPHCEKRLQMYVYNLKIAYKEYLNQKNNNN